MILIDRLSDHRSEFCSNTSLIFLFEIASEVLFVWFGFCFVLFSIKNLFKNHL